ncbi:inhibitor of nuclear factor kappa-B kinase subunit alpha-like [Acanthaster planci]|uniref:IkappaB kinase n=1 Tax=Acanthaster planci TaxID=133434 RepID=A0A8B8A3L9_ACAPL|nr:inhibitor of nuclear factor kappa-B kinase subunit alpha-like [Acanthaster planci]XP_022110393.1 inhibitor of nuclear factor kappa-B kinase subunit alpha-like [Acanthaster planci]XP_022110481.1 inhibitor of nuclear factor kappa-B kinase subunit alpha-like [Acanthaster planci]
MATAVKEIGSWQSKGTLGQGGFGTVVLWQHKDSKEELALKQCRVTLDAKNKKRWVMEIDIMKRLKHQHIVEAKEVPAELQLGDGELPLLGMEYCRRGDLRKVLCRPENCCGLKQEQVLQIAKHVFDGVEYLHSKRIIHRDLKPENIVIQENENGQFIYKLTDLGYAKDLDQGSVASTFVGTLQYLAPELFASQKYNQTVDYWTLGTVLFECITGSRPFLPHMPPVKWHGTVKQKTDMEICAYINEDGAPIFTEYLLTPNHLVQIYQNCFEMLLRTMLKFEPDQRGGSKDPATQRPQCFAFLDKMIAMHVVNVLYMNTDTLYNYAIRDVDTISCIHKQLEKDTGVPVSEQDILLPTGQSVDATKLAVHYTQGEYQPGFMMFLFHRGNVPETLPSKPKPDRVNMIIQEPKTLLNYNDRKKCWGQAVFFCSQQAREASRLLEGARASMLCIMRLNHQLTGLHKDMMGQMHKLEAKQDMFRSSLEFDIDSYAVQSPTGITSEKMFRSWKSAEREIVEDFDALRRVYVLNGQVNITQTKIVELQKSPFSRQKQVEGLVEVDIAAQKLYRELQQSKSGEAGCTFQDSSKMQNLLIKSINYRNKQTKELFGHLNKLVSCKVEAERLVPQIANSVDEMSNLEKRMIAHQHQRQKDIWTLLKHAVNKVHNAVSPPVSTASIHYSRQPSSSSVSSSSSATPLQSLGSKPLQDSLVLMNQSSVTRSKFDDVCESIKVEQEELLEVTESGQWQFLNNFPSNAQ